jgi:hypothetical protein
VSLALGDVVDGTLFKAGVSGLDFVFSVTNFSFKFRVLEQWVSVGIVVLSAIQVAVTMGYPAAGVMADRIS